MSALTGIAVATVRKALGLDVFAFSELLGVHRSTIYRWEDSTRVVADPLQREILEGLRRYHRLPNGRVAIKALGVNVRRAMVAAGSLAALRVLLEAIVPVVHATGEF